jgi:hypothetical protein
MSTPLDTFVAKTMTHGNVWALNAGDDNWAVCEFNKGEFDAMLLWPEEKGAKACASGEWSGYKPVAIELAAYIESWLPAMKEDGVRININYGPRSRGSLVEPDALAAAYLAAKGSPASGKA